MIPERGEPNPKVRLFTTWYELTLEDGADKASVLQTLSDMGLGDFRSFRALYSTMYGDNFPVCPFCGRTPVDETHVENCQKKPPRSRTDIPEAGGHRRKLPPAAAAIPDFLNVLRHIEEWDLDILRDEESWIAGKAADGSFEGKSFITQYSGADSVTVYREEHSAESWAELCLRHGIDPEELEQLSIPELQRTFGGVSDSPSDHLITLIAISALTPFRFTARRTKGSSTFTETVRKLHISPETIDWDEIEAKTAKLKRRHNTWRYSYAAVRLDVATAMRSSQNTSSF